jgi:hypothetical protein|tara:strand:- start:180 stop:383 length:204 start_codon:yes stop_codon:yes gene_type:complete
MLPFRSQLATCVHLYASLHEAKMVPRCLLALGDRPTKAFLHEDFFNPFEPMAAFDRGGTSHDDDVVV